MRNYFFLILIITCPSVYAAEEVKFENVTQLVKLDTAETWKYGGPTVADFNNDGFYDFILGNHHEVPAFLHVYDPAKNIFIKHPEPAAEWDLHGLAAADYDNDGDNDILVSLGGGNGSTPQPARLKDNLISDHNILKFRDVTKEVGIDKLGARGRSVRWIDLDKDGDLDIIHITAQPIKQTELPRNIAFENLGNGKFTYRPSPVLEKIEAERVLLTDVNSDGRLDLLLFSPLSILIQTGDFTFTDKSEELLPEHLHGLDFVMAAAHADIDNDGDFDVYLSRGKTYYQIANNTFSFNPQKLRLDIRDEGNKSRDYIHFVAKGDITLDKFFRWYRNNDSTMNLYVGSDNKQYAMPEKALVLSQNDALGMPNVEGLGWFLGYQGNDKWTLQWNLPEDYAWDIRASIFGVSAVNTDWPAQTSSVDDVLLVNTKGSFEDQSALLPKAASNSWGVITADFNNDSYADFFVYRFGELNQRVNDLLFLNEQGEKFRLSTKHNATVLNTESHGDMGAAFDFNLDGSVDILSGDDDQGRWYLFQNAGQANKSKDTANYLLVQVQHNDNKIGPQGAKVEVFANGNIYTQIVGSSGSVHSQSNLNTLHFGLLDMKQVDKIKVTYRDGQVATKTNESTNQKIVFGKELGKGS